MKRKTLLSTIAVVLLSMTACAGTFEEAGEEMDEAVEETGEAFEEACEETKDALDTDDQDC